MHSCKKLVDDLFSSSGDVVFFELPPQLKDVKFPALVDKRDSNNGAPANWTRLNCLMSRWAKMYSGYKLCKKGILPRVFWVQKEWTFKDLHLEVFKQMRCVIAEWIDFKDPGTKKKPIPYKGEEIDLSTLLPDFPHRPAGWDADKSFTRADFEEMTLEAQFEMCMPGVAEGSKEDIPKLEEMPYEVRMVDNSGYYQDCYYCK
jgi:hypothetical protein